MRSADSRAWLAYWSQVHSSPGIARIQRIYQRRIESNLRAVLRPLVPKVSLRSRLVWRNLLRRRSSRAWKRRGSTRWRCWTALELRCLVGDRVRAGFRRLSTSWSC
ncbi:MAG: TetR family transcriptional regulator C-terminal domain-containing protein [Phycisphaerae bacterium]